MKHWHKAFGLRRVWLAALLLAGFAAMTAAGAYAQSDNGNIVGTVTDPTGAVVPNATVTVTNVNTGLSFHATSNASGEFRIFAVPRGSYRARVMATGFKSQATAFDVTVASTQTLIFKLEPGMVSTTVQVTSAAPLVDTTDGTIGATIQGKQVTQLPLNGRNFTGLALLTPGVTRGAYGNAQSGVAGNSETFRQEESGGAALSVNGLPPTADNYLLDGLDNNDSLMNTIVIFPNIDATQEFKVDTSVAPAQYGRAGGAIVAASIKSGTNYLEKLGVTAIWITPAYDNEGSPNSYHGYGATNVYRTDPHFGTIRDFQKLVAAVHAHHMKFILGLVPNHVGPGSPWATDPPTPTWLHGTLAHHMVAQSDFTALVDPHADWAQQRATLQGWFANVLPDLNQSDPLVSQYLIQNAIWWIETGGVDGLRLDTFPYVGRAFWQQYNGELHTIFPRLTSVGEVFYSDPAVVSYFAGGRSHDGIDTHLYTPFDYPTFLALRQVLTHRKPMSYLEKIWAEDSLYPHPERLVTFFGNHDNPRFLNLPGMTVADLKLAYGMVLTMRGTPQLYYGDEIAMTGGRDPGNRHDFPGGFPGDRQDAFTAAGRTPVQNEVHDWVQGLLRFRDSQPVFGDGEQQDLQVGKTTIVYLRARHPNQGCSAATTDRVLVAVNDGDAGATLTIDPANTGLAGCTRFTPAAGTHVSAAMRGGQLTIALGPKQVAIYQIR